MEDRIVFPAEEVEAAGKRLKRIALMLDDLSDMLRAAEKSIDVNSLRRAKVQDELSRYVKKLVRASEEAQRLSKALASAWESFVECEETAVREVKQIQVETGIFEKNMEKSTSQNPFSSRIFAPK